MPQKVESRYLDTDKLAKKKWQKRNESNKKNHLLPINGFNPDSRLTMIEGNPVT